MWANTHMMVCVAAVTAPLGKFERLSVPSPLGALTLVAEGGHLTRLDWGDQGTGSQAPVLVKAATQLAAYFAGQTTAFDLPFAPQPSDFAQRFQNALNEIPFGQTRTYGDLAKDLGVSAQAIGQACGANKIPIIVPCHRVLGATNLGGFSGAGGVDDKVWLLRHEGAAGLLI